MLGLRRRTIALCAHEKGWEEEATRTIGRLKAILGDIVKDIAHVGSTAIPAIKAKPIVDIALAVDSFQDILAREEELRANGFYYRPASRERIPTQLLFACGSYYEGTGDLQTHFIHVVLTGSADWVNYINFRDYLNHTRAAAREYEALKMALAEAAPNDGGRETYLRGKQAFIASTLRKALAWSYLGKTATAEFDRPRGSISQDRPDFVYPVNCGFIPGTESDGYGPLEVYLLGMGMPISVYTGKIIGIVRHKKDADDRLVMAPEGVVFTQNEIAEQVDFGEGPRADMEALEQKSCGAVIFRRDKEGVRLLCLYQRRSGTYSIPKGHMEAFESEQEAARREIFEETGLSLSLLPGVRETVDYAIDGGMHKTVVFFLAEYAGEVHVGQDEIASFRWLDLHDAREVLPAWYHGLIEKLGTMFA